MTNNGPRVDSTLRIPVTEEIDGATLRCHLHDSSQKFLEFDGKEAQTVKIKSKYPHSTSSIFVDSRLGATELFEVI